MAKPLIIGLTGSIGMGKTTLAGQFAALGAKVCNADAIVHRLLGKHGEAVELIGHAFPGMVKHGVVDRHALGGLVFSNEQKRLQLEQLLHPLVVEKENRFIAQMARKGVRFIVLDIPLLFETGAQMRCDITVVASAPAFIQKRRVMARPRMTMEKFSRILALQMPDAEKKKLADIVILTGLGKAVSFRQVKSLMEECRAT